MPAPFNRRRPISRRAISEFNRFSNAGQLQLAKSHGLPAFKLTPNAPFDAALRALLASGAPLASSSLRALLAPAATAGVNSAPAGRGLQEEFDGAVACLKGLLRAYEDLSSALSEVAADAFDESKAPPEALASLRARLGARRHALPFAEGGSAGGGPARSGSFGGFSFGGSGGGGAAELADDASSAGPSTPAPAGAAPPIAAPSPAGEGSAGEAPGAPEAPLLEAARANAGALLQRLRSWEAVVRSHQTPSRVVKWAM